MISQLLRQMNVILTFFSSFHVEKPSKSMDMISTFLYLLLGDVHQLDGTWRHRPAWHGFAHTLWGDKLQYNLTSFAQNIEFQKKIVFVVLHKVRVLELIFSSASFQRVPRGRKLGESALLSELSRPFHADSSFNSITYSKREVMVSYRWLRAIVSPHLLWGSRSGPPSL